MAPIFVTVFLVPSKGKADRIKTLLEMISTEVEGAIESVLQFQIFEELSKQDEPTDKMKRLVVQIKCKDEEAIDRYHSLESFRNFWKAISDENLLAVPFDGSACRYLGGFTERNFGIDVRCLGNMRK